MSIIFKNKLICFLILAVIVTGGALAMISQQVYDTQKSVSAKSRDLVAEQWGNRALKAEWAYLTRPDRLDELSNGTHAESKSVVTTQTILIQELEKEAALTASVPIPQLKPISVLSSQGRSPVPPAQPLVQDPKPASNFSTLLKSIGGDR